MKRFHQQSLLTFCNKKRAVETETLAEPTDIEVPNQCVESGSNPENYELQPIRMTNDGDADGNEKSESISDSNDIGLYAGNSELVNSLSDEKKVDLLHSIWKPTAKYRFPKKISSSRNKNHMRTFQIKWLEEYKWLSYSRLKEGSFCKYCVLFYEKDVAGKGKHQTLGSLVTKPSTDLKDAREILKKHEKNKYHKDAVLAAENIASIIHKKQDSIILQMNKQKKQEIIDNRKRLIPFVQTIRLCGRQQIPLRGKVDSGRISLEEPANNDGNFRTLLRYRANSGDAILKENLETSGGNSMYTSSVIQNEIINIFGELIQQKIVAKVKHSNFFSVLADETTDISQIEQFSLCVRYFDEEELKLREDFLAFIPVKNLTGCSLATTIMENLVKLGFDLNDMRGQGYDGAAAMRGQFRGVQACIRKKYPKAIYTHCMSHSLNLCLSDASKMPSIRNCMGVISETCSFFHASAKRTSVLKESIQRLLPDCKKVKMKTLCETRWIQRHDAVLMFKEGLHPIISSLEAIEQEESAESSVKAHTLLNSICQFSFLVATFVLSKILSITYNLSENFQNKQIDLVDALEKISEVTTLLNSMRTEAEKSFSLIYDAVKTLAVGLKVAEEVPRRCSIQKNRCNVPYSTPEEYFRRSIFIPFVDDIIESLNERFQSQKETLTSLQNILPVFAVKNDYSQILSAVKMYESDLGYSDVTESEYQLWCQKWEREKADVRPKNAVESLASCNKNLFPNIYILLHILAILPVTTASVERSFSSLRRLKSYLRNSTSESRLNGLALLSIHRDIQVEDEEVIDKFGNVPRRINLSF